MKFYLCLVFVAMTFLIVGFQPVFAGQGRIVRFHAPSHYGHNYASGFDRGYAAAWNACRTGGKLRRWVRDWSNWVITNPAYVRGYRAGVKQALSDAEFLTEEGVDFSNFYGEEER
jgi:hypothetical protein